MQLTDAARLHQLRCERAHSALLVGRSATPCRRNRWRRDRPQRATVGLHVVAFPLSNSSRREPRLRHVAIPLCSEEPAAEHHEGGAGSEQNLGILRRASLQTNADKYRTTDDARSDPKSGQKYGFLGVSATHFLTGFGQEDFYFHHNERAGCPRTIRHDRDESVQSGPTQVSQPQPSAPCSLDRLARGRPAARSQT